MKSFLDNLTNNQKKQILSTMKNSYENRISFIGNDDDLSMYSWKNKKLNFIIIGTYFADEPDYQRLLYFSTFSNDGKNQLRYVNLISETNTFAFESLRLDRDRLNYLFEKRKIINNDSIIDASIGSTISDIGNMQYLRDFTTIGKDFADAEYEKSIKSLKQNLTQSSHLKLITSQYYTDRFHFDDLMQSISDEQLSYELEDCLNAYEQKMWFVCSTGIGSVIEHLLYLSIQNLDKKWELPDPNDKKIDEKTRRRLSKRPLNYLGNDPTRSNYMTALTIYLPHFDKRKKSQLEAMFLLRNSVDHFNSGYSNKGFCDTLLQGIVDTYNGIYLPSL